MVIIINYAMSASNCACVMCVMDARAQVPVFENVHVRMKRIHITCIWGRDRDIAERAHWLTVTHILGSVWPTVRFCNREKPIQSIDIPLL